MAKYKMIVRYRKNSTVYDTCYFDNCGMVDTSINQMISTGYTPEVINVYVNLNRSWKVYLKYSNGKCVVDNSWK